MGLQRSIWLLFVACLLFGGVAMGDTIQFNGTYAFANSGYGIPPYGGTLDGQTDSFYCVDFSHDISAGDSWNVAVVNLTGLSFSGTRLGDQTTYLEMAWLVTQMMSTSSQLEQAEDQYAIWSFTGGPNPYGTNSSIVASALVAVNAGFTGQAFEILTPTGSTGQEFLILVPEPAEVIMLTLGLSLLPLVIRRRVLIRKH